MLSDEISVVIGLFLQRIDKIEDVDGYYCGYYDMESLPALSTS